VPYGVYDLAANARWVSVGVDHDTAAPCSLPGASFAVNSIRRWWLNLGRVRYLLITVTPTPARACEAMKLRRDGVVQNRSLWHSRPHDISSLAWGGSVASPTLTAT
jgi:hypothetical protein